MKLCKDCKHCKPEAPAAGYEVFFCHRDPGRIDIVSGRTLQNTPSCRVEREGNWLGARLYRSCGMEGRYWELRTATK